MLFSVLEMSAIRFKNTFIHNLIIVRNLDGSKIFYSFTRRGIITKLKKDTIVNAKLPPNANYLHRHSMRMKNLFF